MADRYLLETSATDGYLLEDGSGVLLLETAEPIDKWYIAPPVSTQRRVLAAAVIASIGLIAPFVPDASAAVLSSDGPVFTRTVQYQSTAFVTVVAEPETVTLDKWHQPPPDPTRPKRQPASELAAPVFVPAAAAEETSLDKWFSESSQPLRRGRGPASEFAAPFHQFAVAAEVPLDGWYQAWPGRLWVKARPQFELPAAVFTAALPADVIVPTPVLPHITSPDVHLIRGTVTVETAVTPQAQTITAAKPPIARSTEFSQ